MISVGIAWIPCVIVVFLECCWLGRGRGSWSWFWYNLGFWSWFSSDHRFWSWFRCYFFFPLDLNPKNISELQKRDIERKDEVGANLYSNEFDSSTRWNIPQWFRAVQQLLLCVLIRSFGDVVEAVDDHNLQNSFFDCKEGVFHPKSSVKACLRRKHLKKGKCYGNLTDTYWSIPVEPRQNPILFPRPFSSATPWSPPSQCIDPQKESIQFDGGTLSLIERAGGRTAIGVIIVIKEVLSMK